MAASLVAGPLTNNDTFWIMVMIIVALLSIFVFVGYVAKLAADALGTYLLFI